MNKTIEELENKIKAQKEISEYWEGRYENMKGWKESLEGYNILLDPIVWLVAGNSFLFGVLVSLLVIFAK